MGRKMSVTVPVSVPVKPLRDDADDLEQSVAHPERAADHVRILPEAARPIVVGEHRVGMRAGLEIVVFGEQAA